MPSDGQGQGQPVATAGRRPVMLGPVEVTGLWTGALSGVVAWALALVLTLVAVALAIVGAAGSVDRDAVSASSPFGSFDYWSLLMPGVFQMLAMAFLGPLTGAASASLPFVGSIGGSGSIFVVPLTVTVGTFVLVMAASALAERRWPSASRLQAAAQAVVTGIVLTLLVNVGAALVAITVPGVPAVQIDGLRAVSGWSVLLALVIGGAAAWTGRRFAARRTWAVRSARPAVSTASPAEPAQPAQPTEAREDTDARGGAVTAAEPGTAAQENTVPAPQPARQLVTAAALRSAVRGLPAAILTHLLVVAVLTIPVAVIGFAIDGKPLAILSLPLTLLNLAGYLLVAGHLGPLHLRSESSQISSGSTDGRTTDELVQIIAGGGSLDTPAAIGWIGLVVALIAAVAAGLILGARRRDRTPLGWLTTAVGYAVTGAVLCLVLAFSAHVDVRGYASADAGVGPSWWFVLIFAAWGLAVEAVAMFLAPVLLPVLLPALPGSVRARLAPAPVASPAGAAGTMDADGAVPAGATAGAAVPARQPWSRAAKKRAAIIGSVAGVVILAVVAGLITTSVIRGGNGPDKQVSAYLQALVDGDADKALALGHTSVADSDRALLSSEAYRKATDRPDGFSIVDTDVKGDTATVRAELRQAGRTHTTSYRLHKQGSTLVDDGWTLDADDTQKVYVTVSGTDDPKPQLNGVEIPVQDAGYSDIARGEAPVLPGTYTVSLPGGSKYLAAEDATVQATIDEDGDTSAELKVDATDALGAEVKRQVDAKLAACAKSTDIEPTGCPFRGYAFDDTRNVAWKITDIPSVRLSSYGDNGSWRFYAEDSGTATVTYEEDRSFGSEKPRWTKESDDVSFSFSGTATVDGDDVTVELSKY